MEFFAYETEENISTIIFPSTETCGERFIERDHFIQKQR